MTRKNRILLSIAITVAIIAGSIGTTITAAEEPYTAAEEAYMQKQAANYYLPDDPLEEFIDAETGEVAWKALPPGLRESAAQRGSVPSPVRTAGERAGAAAKEKRRQETRRDIRSYSSAAMVEWGIPAVSIPEVMAPGTADTIWGPPKSFSAPAKRAYRVLSKGTEIRIALLASRVDLPEGVLGQLTRPVYDSRGEEIFPQTARIFGRYNYYDQSIAWEHVILGGEIIKLDNPEEFQSAVSLAEQTEPGYKLSVRIQNTILLSIPTM